MNIPADRLAALMYYMKERETIRLKKEAGEPWPWTGDEILQRYKFTNIKRAHDRTTRGFVQHYNAHYRHVDSEHYLDATALLYNCGVARYFGTLEFKLNVGYLGRHDGQKLASVARSMLKRGEKVFTGAYIVTNSGQHGPKHRVVISYLEKLWQHASAIVDAIYGKRSWEAGYREMFKLPGFKGSGFMAKEVLQDFLLVWKSTSRVDDYLTWTPMGPGARRGINRLLNRPTKFHQPESVFIDECVELTKRLSPWWSDTFPEAEPLTAHDVQFCLCEFDKYERARKGPGRPRSLYRPPEKN